jgi:hypothetical protein
VAENGTSKAHLIWVAALAALAVDVVLALAAKVNFKLPTF